MKVIDLLNHFFNQTPYQSIFNTISYCVDDSDYDNFIYFTTNTMTDEYLEFLQKYSVYIVNDWIYDTVDRYLHLTLITPEEKKINEQMDSSSKEIT